MKRTIDSSEVADLTEYIVNRLNRDGITVNQHLQIAGAVHLHYIDYVASFLPADEAVLLYKEALDGLETVKTLFEQAIREATN